MNSVEIEKDGDGARGENRENGSMERSRRGRFR